jgi:uncharacterized protein (TIGR02300 family)
MTRDNGMKHVCFKCGTKFYDLHKPAPICPKCGADQRESPKPELLSGKRQKAKPRAEEDVPAVASEEVEESEEPDEDDVEEEEEEADL